MAVVEAWAEGGNGSHSPVFVGVILVFVGVAAVVTLVAYVRGRR